MKKRMLALLLACGMMATLLAGCGGGSGSGGSGSSGSSGSGGSGSGSGESIDLTEFAVSLGSQWFTEEDEEIWAHIEDPSSNPDKIVWRHGAVNRSFNESPTLRGDKRFFIELKKALGDRIEFQFYFNSALGGTADQILGGLQAKSFEGYSYNVGAFYEYTRAFTPLDVGFLIPSLEAGIAVSDSGSAARELMVNRCIDDCGLRVMMMGAIGMRHITNSTRPVETLEDLKGLKIRVQNNNLHMALFEKLGASPTPIAFSELFTALQQKTVDGQENPIANIFEQNYVEVQKYFTLSNHLYTAAATVVNEEWYQSLPQDVRDVIDAACVTAQEQSGKDLLNCEQQMLEYMEGAGFEVTELTPEAVEEFKALSEGTYDMAAEVMGADYWNSVRSAIEEIVADYE